MGVEVEYDEISESPDLERINEKEFMKAGINTQKEWQDNMRSAGWVNTGETVNSITVRRKGRTVEVGSSKISALIHEYGRAPDNTIPPEDPIKDWVKDVGIASPSDEDFDSVVWAVRMSIAREGIEGSYSGNKAFRKVSEELFDRLSNRLDIEYSF